MSEVLLREFDTPGRNVPRYPADEKDDRQQNPQEIKLVFFIQLHLDVIVLTNARPHLQPAISFPLLPFSAGAGMMVYIDDDSFFPLHIH